MLPYGGNGGQFHQPPTSDGDGGDTPCGGDDCSDLICRGPPRPGILTCGGDNGGDNDGDLSHCERTQTAALTRGGDGGGDTGDSTCGGDDRSDPARRRGPPCPGTLTRGGDNGGDLAHRERTQTGTLIRGGDDGGDSDDGGDDGSDDGGDDGGDPGYCW